MKFAATLLIISGVLGLLFAFNMDTSVYSPYGSVNNIGLMQDRQLYLTVSGIAFLAGIILLAATQFGGSRASQPSHSRQCQFCKEAIAIDAIKCRFCGTDFDPDQVSAEATAYHGRRQAKADDERKFNRTVLLWVIGAVVGLAVIKGGMNAIASYSAPQEVAPVDNRPIEERLVANGIRADLAKKLAAKFEKGGESDCGNRVGRAASGNGDAVTLLNRGNCDYWIK